MVEIADVIDSVKNYHPTPNVDIIQGAYSFAERYHEGQTRRSGEPYVTHPVAVAQLLTRLRLDVASVVTGLLHDTVEDTEATLEDIQESFGSEVAQLVDGVTKLSQIRFDNSEHKQAENFRKMLLAMAQDIRVVLVKLCDRLHNMSTLEHLHDVKRRRIAQETLEIYAPLANRLGIHWLKSQLEDQSFQYLYPEDYYDLRRRVERFHQERSGYVEEVSKLLRETLDKHEVSCEVQGRQKHLYSIYKKMALRRMEFEQIYDIVAFRVLVDTVGQCYEVLGNVHAMWRPIPGRFKDYIAMPKPNNYRSLHTSVIGPKGERIEIQIRTHEMHQINEEGIAAHWEYKEKSPREPFSQQQRRQYAWLRQLLEWQQDLHDPSDFLDAVKFDLFTDEVFVFTPRGEVIALKRGATPIDFAYAIHSEIGSRCAGAKINGRMVPLRYELQNGDLVEVITHPNQKPSKDWLSFVKTGKAKARIRNVVRAEERERSEALGREMLERELRRHGKGIQSVSNDGSMEQFINGSRYIDAASLFIAIGYGKVTAQKVAERLLETQEPVSETGFLERLVKRTAAKPRTGGGIVVMGEDDILVRFGKCCNPLPGENVTGFVTRGRGITVHQRSCPRILDADPERRIEVTWDKNAKVERPVSVRVMTTDGTGILATISQVFTDAGVNISQANCKVTDADRAVNTFEVIIRSSEQLMQVMSRIRQLKGVTAVERV